MFAGGASVEHQMHQDHWSAQLQDGSAHKCGPGCMKSDLHQIHHIPCIYMVPNIPRRFTRVIIRPTFPEGVLPEGVSGGVENQRVRDIQSLKPRQWHVHLCTRGSPGTKMLADPGVEIIRCWSSWCQSAYVVHPWVQSHRCRCILGLDPMCVGICWDSIPKVSVHVGTRFHGCQCTLRPDPMVSMCVEGPSHRCSCMLRLSHIGVRVRWGSILKVLM